MLTVVLGMHKSGTSLVAEMLHRSGIHMGDFPDLKGYDEGEKWEREEPKKFNKMLLGDQGVYSPRLKKITDGRHHPEAEAMALEFLFNTGLNHKVWGFKDPRTCLTLHFWRELFPASSRYLFIYRDLDEVLLHYLQRNRRGRTREQELELMRDVAEAWYLYNQECLGWTVSHPEQTLVLSYHALLSGQQDMLRLQEFCGREMEDCRRDDMYRSRRDADLKLPYLDPELARRCSGLAEKIATLHSMQSNRWKQSRGRVSVKTTSSAERDPFCGGSFSDLFSMSLQVGAITAILTGNQGSLLLLAENEDGRSCGLNWLNTASFENHFEARITSFSEKVSFPQQASCRTVWLLGDISNVTPLFLKSLRKKGISHVVTGASGDSFLWPLIWRLARYYPPQLFMPMLPGLDLKPAGIEPVLEGPESGFYRIRRNAGGFPVERYLKKYSDGLDAIHKLSRDIRISSNGVFWPPLPSSREELKNAPPGSYVLIDSRTVLVKLPKWPQEVQDLCLGYQSRSRSPWVTWATSSPLKPVEMISLLPKVPVSKAGYNSSKNPGTIMLVTSSLKAGGAERQWANLANLLAGNGYKVVLFVFETDSEKGHYLPLVRGCAGITVCTAKDLRSYHGYPDEERRHWFSSAAQALFPARQKSLAGWFLSAMGAIDYFNPRLVYAQMDSPNVVAAMAAMYRPGLPVAMSFRNQPPHLVRGKKHAYFRELYKACLAGGMLHMSANSESGAGAYAEWLQFKKERIHLLKNISDPRMGKMDREKTRILKRREMNIPDERRVILGVFRLVQQKRPDLFIETARVLCLKNPDLCFWLAGAGDKYQECIRLVDQAKLSDRISILGRREDVWELMCAADVLLHTSEVEGTPNALIEAQMLGLPIVSTDVGGIPSIIKHGRSGILCGKAEPGVFVREVENLLANPQLRLKLAETARRSHEEGTGDDWLEHIRELTKE